MANILSAQGLAKAHGLKQLFADFSFGVNEMDRIGVIGVNGSGKSTLLKIIAGIEPSDVGTLAKRQGLEIQYLTQSQEFPENTTVLDYIFSSEHNVAKLVREYEECAAQLGEIDGGETGGGEAPAIGKAPELDDAQRETLLKRFEDLAHRMDAGGAWEFEARARIVLSRLGVHDFAAQLTTLSGGYRKRVALAHALLAEADLLLLDEPTNHLDAATISWLEGYLARYPGAVMLVTHDRYFLDRVTRRLFEIERGKLREYPGSFSRYLELKAVEMEQAQSSEERRQNLMRRELEWLKRGAKARSTKQKARVDRAEAMRDTKGPAVREQLHFATQSRRLGNQVLELKKVTKALGGRTLVKEFTHVFTRGEHMGIIGPNGCGKTTLSRMLTGNLEPDSGRIEKGETVAFAVYEQESDSMDMAQRAIDYVRIEGGENLRAPDGSILPAALVMERFLFTPQMLYQPIGKLSGGERRRLYLVKTLMRDPNFLVLDEPTNDLDIMTLEALEEFLDNFGGCLVVISHDRYFLDRTVTSLLDFQPEGKLRLFAGNYSEYEMQKQDEEEELEAAKRDEGKAARAKDAEAMAKAAGKAGVAAKKDAPAAVAKVEKPAELRKLSFKEKQELEKVEAEIPKMETRLASLGNDILGAAKDYNRLQQLTREQATLQVKLDQAVERWSELATRAGTTA